MDHVGLDLYTLLGFARAALSCAKCCLGIYYWREPVNRTPLDATRASFFGVVISVVSTKLSTTHETRYHMHARIPPPVPSTLGTKWAPAIFRPAPSTTP